MMGSNSDVRYWSHEYASVTFDASEHHGHRSWWAPEYGSEEHMQLSWERSGMDRPFEQYKQLISSVEPSMWPMEDFNEGRADWDSDSFLDDIPDYTDLNDGIDALMDGDADAIAPILADSWDIIDGRFIESDMTFEKPETALFAETEIETVTAENENVIPDEVNEIHGPFEPVDGFGNDEIGRAEHEHNMGMYDKTGDYSWLLSDDELDAMFED